MKRSRDAFVAYLQSFEKYCTDTAAAKATGVSRQTISRWLAESREAAKNENTGIDLHFEYGGSVAFLHEHRKQAEKNIVGDVLGGALARARDGTRQPALYQGQTVYKLNPKFEETSQTKKIESDQDLYILGYETRWLRDENFAKVPETVWTPPSNELVLGVLGSYVKRFAKRQTVEHQHNHTGGVLIAHEMKAPRERLPMVEVIEPAAEAVITDASHVLEPGSEPEVIAAPEPQPAPPPPPSTRSLSPLQRDLISRAAALAERNRAREIAEGNPK
jgi:hypothetical protein